MSVVGALQGTAVNGLWKMTLISPTMAHDILQFAQDLVRLWSSPSMCRLAN